MHKQIFLSFVTIIHYSKHMGKRSSLKRKKNIGLAKGEQRGVGGVKQGHAVRERVMS